MSLAMNTLNGAALDAQHADFLALLPRIRTHAEIYFRGINCPQKKADKISETIALAWQRYVRLIERGKDVTRSPWCLRSWSPKR
jgi:hypothetical protein